MFQLTFFISRMFFNPNRQVKTTDVRFRGKIKGACFLYNCINNIFVVKLPIPNTLTIASYKTFHLTNKITNSLMDDKT